MNTWHVFANNTSIEISVFCISGTFTLFSLLLTLYLVFRHLKHWIDPIGQKSIVRILLLVPIYSVVSWLAIIFGDYALYFTLVRDCYEAYALYQFFCLMVHYLGEEGTTYFTSARHDIPIENLLTYFDEKALAFPCCCFTYEPSKRVFLHIKRCSLQYVFVKPLLSLIAILLQMADLYHAGSLSIKYGYFWLSLFLNISAAIALYFIFLFYDLIKKVIAPYKPFLKLISIKILIFFIFWQSMLITLLYYFHVIPPFFNWSIARSSDTIQNVIICFEMAGLAAFNLHAFSYHDYRTGPGENTLETALENVIDIANQKDLVKDTKEVFNPLHKAHDQ